MHQQMNPSAQHSCSSLLNEDCLQAVVDVWQLFEAEFLELWNEHSCKGDAYPGALFGESAPQGQQAQQV